MRSVLMQDWTTIRGSGTTAVVQTKSDWLDLEPFADAIFWIETTEVTSPGAGTLNLTFETAPSADESLFAPLDSLVGLQGSTVYPARKLFMNATPNVPLARYLRWNLSGSTAGTWDVTFRIYLTVGQGVRDAFTPLAIPGLLLWLRADQGIVFNSGNVDQWFDLSGNGNNVAASAPGNRPAFVTSAINGRPAINCAGSKWLESSVTSLIGAGGIYSVLAVAKNGNGGLFTLRRTTPCSSSVFVQSAPNTFVFSDGVTPNMTVLDTSALTQSSSTAFKSCHRYNGAGTLVDVFINGAQKSINSSGKTQTTESGTTGFQVGANPGNQFWNGLISEVIVAAGAISDLNRQKVELYQRDFFGV